MELKWTKPVTWASILILHSLTVLNVYYTLRLLPSDEVCSSRGMTWTPVTQGLDYKWKMFPPLTFFTESKYFGEPVEEADKRWQELLPDSPISIPKSRLHDLQLAQDKLFLHPPRDQTSVLALPEVFIQLGCINLLRQHLVRMGDSSRYFKNPAFLGSQNDIMHRADLCIDRLREALMCWGDLSSILQLLEKIPEDEAPRSAIDFASKHKCRDFDAVARWTEENAVKAVRMNDMWWGGRVFY